MGEIMKSNRKISAFFLGIVAFLLASSSVPADEAKIRLNPRRLAGRQSKGAQVTEISLFDDKDKARAAWRALDLSYAVAEFDMSGYICAINQNFCDLFGFSDRGVVRGRFDHAVHRYQFCLTHGGQSHTGHPADAYRRNGEQSTP